MDVVFTGPRAIKTTQPAFWDGDRSRVRYAPQAVGAYTLRVLRNGQATAPIGLDPKRFRCIPSASSGFVRRDPSAIQRFVFDGGQTYYPLGRDAAWLNPGQSYDATFTQMQAAGMNWARVWVTVFGGKNFEWAPNRVDNPKPGPLLLDTARRWDALFDLAEKHGIYIQMTLRHYGQYTAYINPNWADNPWNANTDQLSGGFLPNP